MRIARTTLLTAIAIGLLAGSTVSVAAQEEPVEVTGSVTFSGGSFTETWETNDPRLTGTGTWDPSEGFPDEAMGYMLNGRFLETDGGTWRQLRVPTVNIPGEADDPVWDMVLVGEDGYEGLVFIAQATWPDGSCPPGCPSFDVHGYIVDADES